eukprot:gene6392-10399_t
MSSSNQAFDVLFKILLIGDMAVGKSCILMRYADDVFNSTHVSTIGVDFKIRTINFDGKVVKLQIWDTAGQERFRTITTSYYKGAHGVIMVYDITKKESFDNLQSWLNDIQQYAEEDVGIILVGNKVDLENQRQVQKSDGEDWAKKLEVPFLETSAKDAQNVDDAFTKMVERLFEKKVSTTMVSQSNNDDKIVMSQPKAKKKVCLIL